MELTILMPCLNEDKTIACCIEEASSFLVKSGISGEILIAAFAKAKLPIAQVDIGYREDRRDGKSHVRTIRDGLRHLFYMIRY